MTDLVWPSVVGDCMACGRRRVPVTWFSDARRLCGGCQRMPSRVERFTPVLEDE